MHFSREVLVAIVALATLLITASASPAVHLNILDRSTLTQTALLSIADGSVIQLGNDVCTTRNFCGTCTASVVESRKLLQVTRDLTSMSHPDEQTIGINVLNVMRCVAVYGTEACTYQESDVAAVSFDPHLFQRQQTAERGYVVTVLADRLCNCLEMNSTCAAWYAQTKRYYGDAIEIGFKLFAEIEQLGDLDIFQTAFVLDVTNALGGVKAFDRRRLSINDIRAGSTLLDLLILPSTGASDLTPTQVVQSLHRQLNNTNSLLSRGVYTSLLDPSFPTNTRIVARCPDSSFTSPCICATDFGGIIVNRCIGT